MADLCSTLMNASPVPHVLCSSKGTITRLSRAAGEAFQRNYHETPPLLISNTTNPTPSTANKKTTTTNTNNNNNVVAAAAANSNKPLTLQHLLPTRYGNPANVL